MNSTNVLIINPPIRLEDKPRHIPHGLAIIANKIREKLSITPFFFDINAFRYSPKQVEEKLTQIPLDIVLIGGLAPTYKNIIELSTLIKSINPNSTIIVGGYVAMPVPEILFKNSLVDIICLGEGEETIIELLNTLILNRDSDLSGIKGICYRSGDKVLYAKPRQLIKNLDKESILPAYDLLPMNIYLSNPIVGIGRDIDFISSRGCAYKCSFCYQPWGNQFRSHSVDFIIEALLFLKNKYKIDFVSFQDDEFMMNKDRVYRFCEKRNELLPNLLWSCTGRVDIVSKDKEIIKTMKDSGCVLISYGFESGSQRMLDKMNKCTKIGQMEKVVKISRKYGMPIPASFIIGMPGEDEESCNETLEFCIRNNLPLDSLMFATPYPGSEIFNYALKNGKLKNDKIHEFMLKLGDARNFTINLTDYFSDEELIKKREEMIKLARDNYNNYISDEEIKNKIRILFGNLMDINKFDQEDIEHRMKHGGINTF